MHEWVLKTYSVHVLPLNLVKVSQHMYNYVKWNLEMKTKVVKETFK